MVDLFATSLNHRLSVYFAPMSDPMVAATDAMLQDWDHLQACAFPPVAMIRAVLNKIRSSVRAEITLIAPFWPVREWFPDLLSLLSEPPIPLPVGSAPSASCQKVPSKVIRSSSSCVKTLQQHARAAGFSAKVA